MSEALVRLITEDDHLRSQAVSIGIPILMADGVTLLCTERERRDQEDLFLLLCFSDMLGIPNPVNYYTLELLPHVMERFHQWHLRQGMERSPLEGFR